ncbi:hypothetical protein Z043_107568 [Scleropages formosus]|uniref:Uncharacterized protein n=1 Tax=Scleropages formosus TaxID=113540 RepID=A0A0P7UWW6_SCLFO|nr:hypothetical protein Z043_107568 [Scleropages formosus]
MMEGLALLTPHPSFSGHPPQLFLSVGNSKANQFWAATLSPEDELHPEASRERRTAFVHRKYKERRYTPALEGFRSQEQLDKALCAAVVQPDVMQTMALAFSGANVMCATGDPVYSTPYLLAQKAGQNLQMEFLHLNKLSDFSKLDVGCRKKPPRDVPSFKTGFLYVAVSSGRSVVERRARDGERAADDRTSVEGTEKPSQTHVAVCSSRRSSPHQRVGGNNVEKVRAQTLSRDCRLRNVLHELHSSDRWPFQPRLSTKQEVLTRCGCFLFRSERPNGSMSAAERRVSGSGTPPRSELHVGSAVGSALLPRQMPCCRYR